MGMVSEYLQLALLNLVPDDNTMAFELAFSIEAECTPYGSQHSGTAQWIKDSTQHMMDRAATELAAAAGVSQLRQLRQVHNHAGSNAHQPR